MSRSCTWTSPTSGPPRSPSTPPLTRGGSPSRSSACYVPVPKGDYYVPTGGTYFGVEIVRRPDLDALHRRYLDFAAARGMTPLGAVGADYRPHITLGVTEVQPALPPLDMVPLGELDLTLAHGPIGPYGSFPTLGPASGRGGADHTSDP